MRALAPFVFAMALSGCAAAASSGGGTGSSLLLHEEMAHTDLQNAYDAIAALRPQWLRARGSTSIQDPKPAFPNVYVDGRRAGELDNLRSMHVRDVIQARFWSPGDAAVRFGMGHPRGVIEIMTVRRGGDGPRQDPTP